MVKVDTMVKVESIGLWGKVCCTLVKIIVFSKRNSGLVGEESCLLSKLVCGQVTLN